MTTPPSYDALLAVLLKHVRHGNTFAVAAALSLPVLHTNPELWASLRSAEGDMTSLNNDISEWHCDLVSAVVSNSIAYTDGETQQQDGEGSSSSTSMTLTATDLFALLVRCGRGLRQVPALNAVIESLESGGSSTVDLMGLRTQLSEVASRKRGRSPSQPTPTAENTDQEQTAATAPIVAPPIIEPQSTAEETVQSILAKYKPMQRTSTTTSSPPPPTTQQKGLAVEVIDEDEDFFPTPPESGSPQGPKRRQAFSAAEDDAIIRGMGKFAPNAHRFTTIFNTSRSVWAPSRTPQHLYDRWRNVLRNRVHKS